MKVIGELIKDVEQKKKERKTAEEKWVEIKGRGEMERRGQEETKTERKKKKNRRKQEKRRVKNRRREGKAESKENGILTTKMILL